MIRFVAKRFRLPRPWWVPVVAAILFLAPVLVAPRLWCGRGADALFDGRRAAQEPLVRAVAGWVRSGVSTADFKTGHDRFDGEWAFGTYQMAGLGLCQFVIEHPQTRDEYLPVIELCIERMLAPEAREFDHAAWGEDALETLEKGHGHAAYLGYTNLLLGLYRTVAPEPRFSDMHDRITAALARRLDASASQILATYPREGYPVDNCAVVGSLGLYDRATGADHGALVRRWVEVVRARYVDGESGMLCQAVDPSTGAVEDSPRASGTALGAYMVSFADPEFARELFDGLRRSCRANWIGFGLVREYPPNVEAGQGDIDSGPVLFGMSFSGTGFALAGCRIAGDRGFYREIYRTAHIVGAPLDFGGRRSFVCGGPLGNAIMLAMLTAQPGKRG